MKALVTKPFVPLSAAFALALSSCATQTGQGAPPAPTPLASAVSSPTLSSGYGLFLSAQAAASQGEISHAAVLFDRASAASPDEPYLRGRAFTALLLAGQVERADAVGSSGALEGDENTRGLATLTHGVEVLAEGRGKDAFVTLSDNSALGAHSLAASLLRPWVAAAAGDWDAAGAAFGPKTDKLVAAFGGLSRAQVLETHGRLGDAEAVYRSLSASHEVLFVLAHGEFLERRGRQAEAITLYTQTLNRSPDDQALKRARQRAQDHAAAPALPTLREGAAAALFNPAAILLAERQSELGLSYLRLALRLDPNRSDAWVLAGETLGQMGDVADSRAALERVKPGSDSYAAARVRLVLSYQQAGEKDTAIRLARETLTATPDDPSVQVVYAELLRDSERYQDAIGVLDTIIARSGSKGSESRLYYLRGANKERAGQWLGAEDDLRHALKLAPNDAEVLNYLGFAWVDRGEHLKEALDMLQRAVALAPDSGAIIDSLGWARYRLKDYTGAVKELEKAVALDASDPEINDHLGDCYWRVGRRTEAAYQWRRVLTLNPADKLRQTIETKLKSGLADPLPGPSSVPAA
jgi:tetratricopeptide (TPR) repeat protein